MANEANMSLVAHLTELRKRIIWILVVFGGALIGGLLVAIPLIQYMKGTPPLSRAEWNSFSPWDAIHIYMMVAFICALMISLPFILYQAWSYMKPGLHQMEQRAALRYIPGSIFFFAVGCTFAYFIVLPMALSFTSFVTHQLELVETYGITQYFSFVFNIILQVSLLFQLPVVIMFLTEIHILNPERLKAIRRYAYLFLVIISTMVTPPDAISAIIVAGPLILLFESSVLFSSMVHRKQIAKSESINLIKV